VRGARPFAGLEAGVARAVAPRAGETLVAAISGGPDSVALAALLSPATRAVGASIVLVHVNAGLRPSAWQDEAVVLGVGAALGARVVCVSLSPGSADEARLRDERYAALVAAARVSGATRVVLGHHAADQTETVLLALLRGTGPAGLVGMLAERELAPGIRLLRPLLGTEPAELHAYVLASHLPYAVDPSNADVGYRRNAVRVALQGLRQSFPHLDGAVARCAAIVCDERADSERARLRVRLREEIVAATGDVANVSFERLDSAARALESGRPGRHFLRRGVELIVE